MVAVSANAKKYVTWAIIALVVFYIATQPNQAADVVRSGVGLLRDGADSILTFMSSLFQNPV